MLLLDISQLYGCDGRLLNEDSNLKLFLMMSKVPLDNNEVQDLRLGQDEAWEGTKKFCCLFQRVIF